MSGLPPPARAPRGAAPPNLHPSQQPHSPRRSYRSSGPGRPAVSSSAPSRWGAEETPQAHQPYRAASRDPGPHRTPERARGGGLRDGLQLLAAHEPLFTPTLQAPRGRPGCGNARARAEAHRAPSVTPRACTDSPSPAPVSHAPRAASRAVDTPGAPIHRRPRRAPDRRLEPRAPPSPGFLRTRRSRSLPHLSFSPEVGCVCVLPLQWPLGNVVPTATAPRLPDTVPLLTRGSLPLFPVGASWSGMTVSAQLCFPEVQAASEKPAEARALPGAVARSDCAARRRRLAQKAKSWVSGDLAFADWVAEERQTHWARGKPKEVGGACGRV